MSLLAEMKTCPLVVSREVPASMAKMPESATNQASPPAVSISAFRAMEVPARKVSKPPFNTIGAAASVMIEFAASTLRAPSERWVTAPTKTTLPKAALRIDQPPVAFCVSSVTVSAPPVSDSAITISPLVPKLRSWIVPERVLIAPAPTAPMPVCAVSATKPALERLRLSLASASVIAPPLTTSMRAAPEEAMAVMAIFPAA